MPQRNGFSFLQEITLAINAAETDRELLALVIDKSIEYTGATSGSLAILTSDGYLDIRVMRGFTEEQIEKNRLRVGQGITGFVARTGTPYLCPDTESDPTYYQIKGNIRSELAVPMLSAGRVIGVLNLDSRRKQAFNETHLETLFVVATYTTRIYLNMHAIDQLNTRIVYQEILLAITEILNQPVPISEKFCAMMGQLQERLSMERGTIVLRRNDGDEYAIHTAIGLTDEEIKSGVYRPGEGITGKIIQSGEAFAVRNIFEEPAFLNRTRSRGRLQQQGRELSFIGVPIRIAKDVIGVLSVDKPFEGERFDDDIQLLTIIASFIAHGLQLDDLLRRERNRLRAENAQLKEEVQSHYSFDRLVGTSPAMIEIYRKIELVANSETTVLITGESGTGKELVADAIQQRSKRRDAAFIKINCAAIPESLMESELFGYRKGAFTGAQKDKKGRIQLADGGTLFLDEIGEMPITMQTKLLRVLQNREIDLVGGELPIPVNVRVLAATSRDLETMVREGGFREDLYYRLNVFRLDIPPLRERRGDIELIARQYLQELADREQVEQAGISFDALERLAQLPLEGNVRELQNLLEQAFLIAGKGRIEETHLGLPRLRGAQPGNDAAAPQNLFIHEGFARDIVHEDGTIYRNVIGDMERNLIRWALGKTGGNRLRAAKLLGINRNTLNAKLREVGE